MSGWRPSTIIGKLKGVARARALLLAAIAADVFVVGILLMVVLKDFTDQQEKAILIGGNVSRVLDQSLTGLIGKIDLTLSSAVEDFQQDAGVPPDPIKIRERLARRSDQLPEVTGITVSDAAGRLVYSTGELNSAGIDISDRPYFKTLREHPDSGLVISQPVLGRVFLLPMIVFSRAYRAPDGSFAGVVNSAVALKSLLKLLSPVDVGPSGVVSLWGETLGLLARYSPQPGTSSVNPVPSPQLARLIGTDSPPTAFHAAADFDGVARMVFYRHVSGWPLYLLVGVADDDYLGGWRQQLAVLGGLAVLFVLGSVGAFLVFSHMMRALASNEARLRLALVAAQQGWFEMDLRMGTISSSDEYVRVLGHGRALFRQSLEDWRAQIHPDDLMPFKRAFEDSLAADQSLDIEYRHRTATDDWLWIRMMGRVVERDRAGKPVRLLGIHVNISERKRSEEMIRELAYFDALTKLPNRRLLMDRLGQALIACNRTRRCGAILFVDLDNFKTLNDSFGHAHGDLLLQEMAKRLVAVVREGDTVARLGGDEFVVVLEGFSEDEADAVAQAETVAEKILESLARPFVVLSRGFHHTASIGIAPFGPGRRQNPDELLKHADIAMYRAKSAGRNRLQLFDPAMQVAVEARASLEADLRNALRGEQFLLYYQPQIDRHQIVGAEALLRWKHPVRGMVSPGAFIALAEETGLIVPLGNWVLKAACRQIVDWQGHADTGHLAVSVNVSTRQFHQPDFVSNVLAEIEKSGANPRHLKLEITETMLLDKVEETITKMSDLKSHGIRFSLDDFGTGYSSLSYLRRLPFDQLKIDQSFVYDILEDANKGAIARTIVALGQEMGLSVIAEGVETLAQRDFLAAIGCHAYQGYLFGRPVPAHDFPSTLPVAAWTCEPSFSRCPEDGLKP
jgi:diguanylate cyclase (GGDEF)-like protein